MIRDRQNDFLLPYLSSLPSERDELSVPGKLKKWEGEGQAEKSSGQEGGRPAQGGGWARGRL